MKKFITPSYVFTSGGSGSANVIIHQPSFNIKKLVAIIDQTQGKIIYSTAVPTLGFTSVSGNQVFLFADTDSMGCSGSDTLQFIYEDDRAQLVKNNGTQYLGEILSDKAQVIAAKDQDGKAAPLNIKNNGRLKTDVEFPEEIFGSAPLATEGTLQGVFSQTATVAGYASNTATNVQNMSNKLPATLGQKTMANSMSVAIASDQGNVQTGIASINTGVMISLSRASFNDFGSGTIGAGTNNTNFTSGQNYQSISPVFNVTAISGTNPTMDISIWESLDSGTNYYKLFDLPRITAIGSYPVPNFMLIGNAYRIVRIIGGTATPTFTMNGNTIRTQVGLNLRRQLIDRTVDPNTAGSVTPWLWVEGTKEIYCEVSMGAGGAGMPTFILEGSSDGGTTFYDLSTSIATVVSKSVVANTKTFGASFVRLKVSPNGTGSTLDFARIKAVS